jgi:hypothetical protein
MSRRRRTAGTALLVAAAVVAAALVWWAPWDSEPSPVTRALEAFGNRPIVHVIARTGIAPGSSPTRSVVSETQWEIWYDRSPRLLHVIGGRGGKFVVDSVGRGADPRVYLLLRGLDSAVGDFVAGFRTDLADGRLGSAGSGTIQGRPILWLRSTSLLVAIDPVSYQALWLRRIVAGRPLGRLTQIVVAETLPAGSGDFQTRKTKKPRHL